MGEKREKGFVFESILQQAKDDDFACGKYYKPGQANQFHKPSIQEIIVHLKLLKAIEKLKEHICHGLKNQLHMDNAWKAFVTLAVRRFIVFISALKATEVPPEANTLQVRAMRVQDVGYMKKTPKSPNFTKLMERLLPPLDIVMVWHALLLNPKAAFELFARNDFLPFLVHPFPLKPLDRAISNIDYSYHPEQGLVDMFSVVINNYDKNGMNYFFNEPFIPENIMLPVKCPFCERKMAEVPLSDIKTNTGFADGDFKYSKVIACCGFYGPITHNELRKREMVADFKRNLLLPNLCRYRSRFMDRHFKLAENIYILDQKFKACYKKFCLDLVCTQDIKAYIKEINQNLPKRWLRAVVLLREYLSMNLVHLTVLSPDCLMVNEDLVGCVLRQQKFCKKMNDINWLESPLIQPVLTNAKLRYDRFWEMMSKNHAMFVPTLDIDIVWHTHQLSFHYYFNQSWNNNMFFIDHNDKVDESKLNNSFKKTCDIYKSMFKEPYSLCMCDYCLSVTGAKKPLFKKVFRSSSQKRQEYDLVYQGNIDATHASIHNAIKFPSKKANAMREKKDYKQKSLAFDNPVLSGGTSAYPMIYVCPPFAPIPDNCQYIYGDTLCVTYYGGLNECGSPACSNRAASHFGCSGGEFANGSGCAPGGCYIGTDNGNLASGNPGAACSSGAGGACSGSTSACTGGCGSAGCSSSGGCGGGGGCGSGGGGCLSNS